MTTTSRTDNLLGILQDSYKPREEGWLWLAGFVEGQDGGVVQEVTGEFDNSTEAANALAHIINECPATHAYLAVCRAEARPREMDREMWRLLRELVTDAMLIDMVMFNRTETWSMREEDASAASAAAS